MTAHLAQVNIARMRGPLESAVMADFVARLDEINALADASPGFVWRLQTSEGNATYLRPYDDDRILFNMSVWRSLEDLRAYVYRSAHAEVLRRRAEWFTRMDTVYTAKLDTTVKSSAGVALAAAFSWSFKTDPVGSGPVGPTGVACWRGDAGRRIGEGTFALQAHDPGSTVMYRNIRVKRLP